MPPSYLAGYIPVIVCAILSIPIGMLWFSHALFGPQWMALSKLPASSMKKGPGGAAYATSIVSAFVMAFTLAMLFGGMGVKNVVVGWAFAILVWVAFHFLPGLTNNMFDKRPVQLLLITSGYQLANALIMATVLITFWN